MRGLLASPLGLLIGVALGALGGGGSVLAVPVLVYLVGQTPKAATTTSLLVVGSVALAGMAGHWRKGQVRLGIGVTFALAGMAASLLGSHLNQVVDPDVLLLAFSGVLGVAAWQMVASLGSTRAARPAPPPRPATRATPATIGAAADGSGQGPGEGSGRPGMPEASTDLTERRRVDLASGARIVVAGSAVGFLTGFFGVGGGFVIVPALVIALRFEMPDAVGTSLLVIALNSAVALSARLAVSGVAWAIAVPFTIAGLAGVTMGTRIADRVPATTLVRWFAALTVVVACYTAIRSATGLLTGPS